MSFFKKLFGNSKKEEVPESSPKDNVNEKIPIQIIEEELNIRFPQRFKHFLKDKLPNQNSVKIELLDGPYKFLDSLFEGEVNDHYENVVSVSNDLNSSYYAEEKEFVKIPFAKSTEGDGFKYLYFVAEKKSEASEKIYLRDIDSPATGSIPLCNQLPFIMRKVGEINGQTIVANTTLNFSEANSWMEIPRFINIWKDSYVTNIREEQKADGCIIDLYLSNYIMEDQNENFSKIEFQVVLNYQNKRIQSAMAFEIDRAGLLIQFANNINYRIFYHKLVCIVGTFASIANDLKKNHNIEIVEYLNTLDLRELSKQDFRGIQESKM